MTRPNVPDELQERVRRRAGNRCGYCLSRQEYLWGKLEVEHIIPLSRGGTNEETNLWLACRPCNSHKASQMHAEDPLTGQSTPLFNPRTQFWREHFVWNDNGAEINGLTAAGRATVSALRLNDPRRVAIRRRWIEVGWHPPDE